jgi:iron complex transport system permease protein
MRLGFARTFVCSVALLVAAVLVSLAVGHYALTGDDLLALFGAGGSSAQLEQARFVFWELRAVRIAAAILVGAALGVAGAAYQGMFVNPLVSPGILGVLGGSSFGFALGILLGLPFALVQASTFVFGFAAVLLALALARIYGGSNSILMLVLGGIISGALFGALVSLVKYTADPYDKLPVIVNWLMGSFTLVSSSTLLFCAPIIIVCIALLSLSGRQLDALSLGDEDAMALGIKVARVRLAVIALATLLASTCVVIAGNIAWVGLIVPHMARFLIGPSHTKLILLGAVMGALFVLVADSISRAAFGVEVPLGIITSLIGIPVFVAILRANRKGMYA